MSELRVKVGDGSDLQDILKLLSERGVVKRIVIEIESSDPLSAIERLRDFLASNISYTIVVIPKGRGCKDVRHRDH